jgi:hypothetical protein
LARGSDKLQIDLFQGVMALDERQDVGPGTDERPRDLRGSDAYVVYDQYVSPGVVE